MQQTTTDKPKDNKGRAFTLLAILAAGALKFKALGVTAVTMILSIGFFAMQLGLPYALGLVLVILIHESGHWIWMKAAGLNPKAPVFIPGLGAYVAMTNMPGSDALHAWVALAGPLIGGLGCAALYCIGMHTNNTWAVASAETGFWLNLVQLIPAKPLDGGFVVVAISRWLLIVGTIMLVGLGLLTGSPLIFIIALMSFFSIRKRNEPAPDALNPVHPQQEQHEQPVQTHNPLPATGWERLLIASAYMTLIVMLSICYFVSASEVEKLTGKSW